MRTTGSTSRLSDEKGGVSVIAGIAALTIGVLAAAAIVVGVMMDHANALPGPSEIPPASSSGGG